MKVTMMRKKQRTSSSRHQDDPKKAHQGRIKNTQRPQKQTSRDSRGEHQHGRSQAVISAPRDSVLAWGRHAVEAALKNPGRKILKIYAAPDMADHLQALIEDVAPQRRPELDLMEKSQLADAVAKHLPLDEKAVHQGVVAVMRPLNPPQLDEWLDGLGNGLSDAKDDDRVVVMILDQITDARNIGAMMRSARAFSARAIITTEKHCPPETGVMLRTASGAAEHIPLIKVVNLSRAIEKLQDHHFMVAGMTAAGQTPIKSLADHDRLGIVMGAEGKGLRRMTEEHADLLVRIPIDDSAESLNVSNAAAVALFAAQRDAS